MKAGYSFLLALPLLKDVSIGRAIYVPMQVGTQAWMDDTVRQQNQTVYPQHLLRHPRSAFDPKWSSRPMQHLTQALPQELWITEYPNGAPTLMLKVADVNSCVCFHLLVENQSCEKKTERRDDEWIFDWLSPALSAVILMRSRGVEALLSLWLLGTLTHCEHTWALPDLPVEETSVAWIR